MGKRWFFVKWGDIIVKIIRFCVCINILSRLNSCRNNWKVFFFIFIISYYLLYYTILYLGLACFMIFSRLVRIQIFISTERSASALARRCPLLPATPFSFLPPRASAWSRTKRGYPLRVGLATLVLPCARSTKSCFGQFIEFLQKSRKCWIVTFTMDLHTHQCQLFLFGNANCDGNTRKKKTETKCALLLKNLKTLYF